MRKLYEIDDGVTYWVIAPNEDRALTLLREYEGYESEDLCEPPLVKVCTRENLGRGEYHNDALTNGTICMWDAYQVAKLFGEGVLACSEW